jgi:O-antigen/teichoic acid export membrane protein
VEDEARIGAVLLGVVTAIGWPLTIWRDALRASQRFSRAALMDIIGLVAYAALVLGLAFADVPLSLLIGASGTIPLLAGLASTVVARLMRLPYRFHRAGVTAETAREFLSLAGYVSLVEAAGVVIYTLDRAILGLFKSAATVALYEGPVRAHNLVRALNAAVTVTALPTASKYLAEGDSRRLQELLVRGTRYTLALVVPLTVTGMALAGPILDVWLGDQFREGDLAMVILLSYWLLNGATGVPAAILVAAGKARTLARYAWSVALANLALSLALTPPLGLEGVTLGTSIPYLAVFPFILRESLRVVPVGLGRLAFDAWIPAYSLGAGLATVLVGIRAAVDLDSVPALVGVAGGGLAAYWLAFYFVWMRPDERVLVRDVARGLIPARAA